MSRKYLAVISLVLLFPAAAVAQDARSALQSASAAMGADGLRTLEFSGSGFDFAIGQAYNPASPWPRFLVKSYSRALNYEMPASRMDRIRAQGENPPRGGGLQPIRGDQPQNQLVIVNANTPWVQQLEIWITPHGFLKAAAANGATARTQTLGGKRYTVVTFTGQNKAPVSGFINEQNLVERVETRIDNAMLGDMPFEGIYSEYKDFGGVKFPTRFVQRQGGHPILDLTITDVKPNSGVTIEASQGRGRGGAPAAAGGAAVGRGGAGAGAPAGMPTEKLADGVHLLLGGYASLAIDFKEYIVVVEGAQSEERGLAVIAEAKRLIPNKPIRYVINTHLHFDHSSGLRPFVAEGATIITHQSNKAWFDKILSEPRSLNPDTLSASKRKPSVEGVGDRRVLTDGNHVVELHRLQGSGHTEGLMMVYLPKLKVLLEADAYNPPAQADAPVPDPVSPYTANIADNIKRLKLDIQRVIPVHYPADNRNVSLAEMMKMAGQPVGTN
jgi:glyoxylase-like metal-dependent hydrolase (beta-lactamase superfamily II)